MLLQVLEGTPFFNRKIEQALLLTQLNGTPHTILLVLGPRSTGTSRLLKHVLLSGRLDNPVSWFSGREHRLSDASVMTQRLTDASQGGGDSPGPCNPEVQAETPLQAA